MKIKIIIRNLLQIKSFAILSILLINPCFSKTDDNFTLAIKEALEKSAELKSSKHLLKSKEKLIDKAYSSKEWDSSITSSFSADNKKTDHQGSYQSDETSLNIISLNRQLLDGGITSKNVLIAKNNYKIEYNNFLLIKQKILLKIVESYLNLYKSNKTLKLRETNVVKFSTHVNASKLKLKAGAITPTTVAEAEARLARAEYQLSFAKTEKQNFKSEFLSFVGNKFDILGLKLPEITFVVPQNLKEATSLAFTNNPLLKNVNLKKNIAFLEKDKQIALNRPSLDIKFQLKHSEASSSNDYSSYGTILTFKTPLFYKESEKHLIFSLQDKYNSIIQEQKEIKRKIKLKVFTSFNNYKNSFINTQAAIKELEAAKLALRGVKKEEEFGMRTLSDVLDYEVDVVNAELNILDSKCNEILQKFYLKYQIGTLDISDVIKEFKVKFPKENKLKLPSIFKVQ